MKNKKRFLTKLTEKITAKKVIAGALVCALFITALPGDFISAGIASAEGETGLNITAAEGMNYTFNNMNAKIDGTVTPMVANENVFSLPSGVPVTKVEAISGEIKVAIPNSDVRSAETFKAGNYFEFTFPEVFSLIEKVGQGKIGEEVICNYSISGNTIRGTFTNSVNPASNLDNVSFGLSFEMTVLTDKVGTEDENTYVLTPTGVTPQASIVLPKVPTSIDTITKTGVLNQDNTLTWTIQIGTDAVSGASLKDITLTENWGDVNIQTYQSAQVNGTSIDLSSGSYTFSDDKVKAPATVTVVTKLTDHAIKSESLTSVSNTATVSSTETGRITGESSATATVAIPKLTLEKLGKQIDGNTIEWEMTLNQNHANVYAAEIYDNLASGLTVDETAGIRITNVDTNVTATLTSQIHPENATGVSAGDFGYEIKTLDDGTQSLWVYFGTFSNTYKIVFDTNLSNSMANNSSVKNQAFVNTYYPNGGGQGPSIWSDPDLSVGYKSVMIEMAAKGVDKTTGTLNWQIRPSTKSSSYGEATITVTVPDDQEFTGIDDVEAVIGESALSTADYTKSYDAVTKTLSLTFTKTKLDDLSKTLKDVKINFATKALTYFETDTEKTYSEKASISLDGSTELVADDTVSQKLKNNLISKSVASGYDDTANEPYFTYLITVNANKLSLTNVEVVDDLSGTLFAEKIVDDEGNTVNITSDYKTASDNGTAISDEYYTVDSVDFFKDASCTEVLSGFSNALDGKKVTVSAASLSDTAYIRIKVKLTEEGKAQLKLAGGSLSKSVIYGKNSASVNATEITAADGVTASAKGLLKSQFVLTKTLIKDAKQGTGDEAPIITWIIEINNVGAEMDSSYTIKDTIQSGLSLVSGSAKLYEGLHTTGTFIDTAKTTNEISAGFNVASDKKKDGSTDVEFTIPAGNESYLLVYKTVMPNGAGTFDNTASVTVGSNSDSYLKKFTAKSFDWATGCRYAILTMTKTDELSGKAVKGAKYGIWSAETYENVGSDKTKLTEGNASDIGYTDGYGKIIFTVPGYPQDAGHTYYVKELATPDAEDSSTSANGGTYELDSKLYEIANVTAGKITFGPNGVDDSTSFTDKRETAESNASAVGHANITNVFEGDSVGNNKSTFKLYLYPTDATNVNASDRKQVTLTENPDGSFTFKEFKDGDAISGTESVRNGTNSESTISIKDLPWGDYKLIQTSTADGYVKNTEAVPFTIKPAETATGSIVNQKTKLTVTDNVAADYTITGKFVGDTTETTKELSGSVLTKTGAVLEGELIQGNTYVISEKIPVPAGYTKHASVEVKNCGTDTRKNLTEAPIKATVVVKDQDGKIVSDANLSVTVDNSEDLSGSSLSLERKISCSNNYTVTGSLTNEYCSIDGKSVKLDVSSDGKTVTVDTSASGYDANVMKTTASTDKNNNTTITIYVKKIKANVKITEKNEKDEVITKNLGTFELYKKNESTGEFVKEKDYTDLYTNGNDVEIKNLTAGEYYLKQTTAPKGYNTVSEAYTIEGDDAVKAAVSGTHFTVKESVDGKTFEVIVKNDPIPGTLNVTKKSTIAGTKTVAGAEYTLYTKDSNNKLVEVYTTDSEGKPVVYKQTAGENGKLSFTGLAWDTYYLKETKAPAGYQLDATTRGEFTFNADVEHLTINKDVFDAPTKVVIKTTGINITDGKDEDDATATKEPLGEGKGLLSKMQYEVTGIFAGESAVMTKTFSDDNKDGSIEVTNEFVLGNTYTFNQVSVKSPYHTAQPLTDVEITDAIAAGTTSIDVVNHMNRVAFQLADTEGNNIAGGKFVLKKETKDSENNVVYEVVEEYKEITSGDGSVEIFLEPGVYTLEESYAPTTTDSAYALDASGVKFELFENNTVKILSVNNDSKYQTAEAAANNKTKVDGSLLGTPGSLKKTDEALITYVNTLARTTLNNIFVDGGEGGKSSSFQLYQCPTGTPSDADVLYQSASGTSSVNKNNGTSLSTVTFVGLPVGTYCLKQTKTAAGYYSTQPTATFTLERDGNGQIQIKAGSETTITDIKTKIKITDTIPATDSNGLAYELYDETQNVTIATINGTDLTSPTGWTSEGTFIVGHKYVLKQTGVPSGYKTNDQDVKTIASFTGDQTIELSEEKTHIKVVIQDQDNNTVTGGTVTLNGVNGSTETDLNLTGSVSVNSEYDISAQLTDQYMPLDKAVKIKMSADGKTYSITDSSNTFMTAEKQNDTTVLLTVQKIKANVVIKEVDETDDTLLTEGKFELWKVETESNGNKTESKINDLVVDNISATDLMAANAELKDLPAGNYYLKQITPPECYNIIDDSNRYEFTVDADTDNDGNNGNNEVIQITVKNRRILGTIKATKKSGDKTVPGATYKLYTKDASGKETVVQTLPTDSNGEMPFKDLAWDTYYLKEVSAPAGYQLSNQEYGPYEIKYGKLSWDGITVTDDPSKVVIKTTGIKLSDGKEEDTSETEDIEATYKVTGIFAGATEIETRTYTDTDKDGVIKVDGEFVIGNTYTFTQTDVQSPYITNTVSFTKTIDDKEIGTGAKSIDVENRMTRVGVRLANEYGVDLGGGKFELRKGEGTEGEVVRTFDSKSYTTSGIYELTGLVPGVYTIVETEAPTVDDLTYALDDSGITFELFADNSVEIKTINTVTQSLRDYDATIAQNDTKVGAVLNQKKSFFKADEAIITYTNSLTFIQFSAAVRYNENCHKEYDTTESVKGIIYGVFKDEKCKFDDMVAEATTDEEGNVLIGGLPLGTYYVKMIASDATNVVMDENTYTVQVTGYTPEKLQLDGAYVENPIQLEVYRQDLELTKTDKDDESNTLAGSTYAIYRRTTVDLEEITGYVPPKKISSRFRIFFDHLKASAAAVPGLSGIVNASTAKAAEDDGWELITTAVTNSAGKLLFDGVDVGIEYMIKETDEPSGYQVSKDPIYVKFVKDSSGVKLTSVDNGNGTASISENGSITWKEPRAKVAVELEDEAGSALSGGTLELYDAQTGELLASWTTDGAQKLFSGVLTAGKTYIIRQTGVPGGYIGAEDYEFTVEKKALSANDDYIQVITITNKKKAAAQPASTDLGKTKKKSPKTGDWF